MKIGFSAEDEAFRKDVADWMDDALSEWAANNPVNTTAILAVIGESPEIKGGTPPPVNTACEYLIVERITAARKADATFPTIPEGKRATWSDDRMTAVLPVVLKPHWDYRLGLNSMSHNNFQSAWGVPLQPVLYTFKTASAD